MDSKLSGAGLRSLIGQWWHVEQGSVSCHNQDSRITKTVTFNTPFTTAPTIFASASDFLMKSGDRAGFWFDIDDVTTTSFTLTCNDNNEYHEKRYLTFDWVAIPNDL